MISSGESRDSMKVVLSPNTRSTRLDDADSNQMAGLASCARRRSGRPTSSE
jgi:hypothetical protein